MKKTINLSVQMHHFYTYHIRNPKYRNVYLYVLISGIILLSNTAWAQNTLPISDTINQLPQKTSPLTINGFVDIYYTYDFNQPIDHSRPDFLYSHNRHNEFSLNTGILQANYHSNRIRGALSLVSGSYARANYAAEPLLFQFVYEAYAGYQLLNHVWLDAGIFASHIGAESAISMDNLTLTRSLMAENSPYYENGIRLTYTPNSQWQLTALLLNGWQNIAETNENKALGTQIQYTPTEGIVLNYSTFFGKESPGYPNPLNPMNPTPSTRRMFHNVYGQCELHEQFTVLAAFDIGFQEQVDGGKYDIWYTPNIIAQYKPSNTLALAGRLEYYSDKAGVIIPTGTPNGFNTVSYSLTLDYRPVEQVAFRLEGRTFNARDEIFIAPDAVSFKRTNSSVIGSMAIRF